MNLTKPQRWDAPKKALQERGAKGVNFAEIPDGGNGMYAWAYRYVTKSDRNAYHSPGHPSLESIAQKNKQTEQATQSQRKKRIEKASKACSATADTPKGREGKQKKRLRNDEVADYCRQKEIKTLDELLADAETRRVNGDDTLSSYIISRPLKSISELLEVVWRMSKAVEKVKNLATPRMESLQSAFDSSCIADCNGLWFSSAVNVLERNNVNKYVYADAMRNLLEKGRGKDRNMYIIGPGNSGKTFLLKPLLLIYPETFSNPASSTFSWIGADEASIIMLNDYRWNNKKNGGNIEWGVFLNLLEGLECTYQRR